MQVLEERRELRCRCRAPLDPGVARLVLAAADLEGLDFEVTATVHDLVHDRGQDHRIDDVAADLDDFAERTVSHGQPPPAGRPGNPAWGPGRLTWIERR